MQEKWGIPVMAPLLEKALIQQPYLEPFGLYGGAHPPAALQNKFLMAEPSRVDGTFSPDEKELQIQGFTVGLVPLPGHSPQQTGILYDGVLFSADVLLGQHYLEKHLIPFNSHVTLHRESLHRLGHMADVICLPAHGKVIIDTRPAIRQNVEAMDRMDDWILERCEVPQTLDELLSSFCSHHQVGMETISQYHLYRTAFGAHLSGLSEGGKICHMIRGSLLRWQTVPVRMDKKDGEVTQEKPPRAAPVKGSDG